MLSLMILSAAISYFQTQELSGRNEAMFTIRIPEIEVADGLQRDLASTDNRTRQIILAGGDPEKIQEGRKAWEADWNEMDKNIASLVELSPHFKLQVNREYVQDLKGRIPKLREIQQKCIETASVGTPKSVAEAGSYYADIGSPFDDDIRQGLIEFRGRVKGLVEEDEHAVSNAVRLLILSLAISSLLGLAAGVFVAVFLSRQISSTTSRVLRKAEAIAAGDLSGQEVEIESQDELGDLAKAINAMQASLRGVIQAISENAQNVANASEEFSTVSQQITANSEETSAQANAVSASTEEVNRNLHTVATATEEMSASISEIAKNASEAARVAGSAATTAAETNAIVTKLGVSSGEIGAVVKVITSIAQKTDLLALNATVEAARAGEVGAGFAVVANEVKELAKQTASATEDISRKIEAIQTDAKAAVQAIGSISGIIAQVNEISGTIAAAVEEQSATTSEMSRNLTDAARGSGQVAQNIGGVAQAAQNTSQGAMDSLRAAQHLAQLSQKLRTLVEQFKLEGTKLSGSRSLRRGSNSGAGEKSPKATPKPEEVLTQ